MKRAELKQAMPPLVREGEHRKDDTATGIYVRESEVLAEEVFLAVLCHERKRSERSGKSILLMLLDVSALGGRHARLTAAKQAVRALDAVIPETAIRGWYCRDAVLGFLMPSIDEAGRDAIRQTVALRLGGVDGPQHLLLFHSFPEQQKDANGQAIDPSFYADLLNGNGKRRGARALKRAIDITGALAGLVLFSPLFLLIPVLIKSTSPGPVLFRQERVGQYGTKFVFLKFRTMSVDSDPSIHREYITKLIQDQKSYAIDGDGGPVYKIRNDPRVTTVGRYLRKTSLDELPQFLNVLRGDMSLVGPRPPITYEVEQYDLWHRRRVMESRPGITGLWQVSGRSSTSFDEMVRLDLRYAREWSLWLDIKILLKTFWVMAAGRGGY